ncbi:uncharacterized protein LOC135687099 [Rhopilema esculentum]|uniref:uncharacterized protein LOC135687099 n=1 Tax=Rhopilema esculentum TaxID=499914 RepID=UPI0031DC1C85
MPNMQSQFTTILFLCGVLSFQVFVHCGPLEDQLFLNDTRDIANSVSVEKSPEEQNNLISETKIQKASDTSAVPSHLPTTVVTPIRETGIVNGNAKELSTSSKPTESFETTSQISPLKKSSTKGTLKNKEVTTQSTQITESASNPSTLAPRLQVTETSNLRMNETNKVTKSNATVTASTNLSATPTTKRLTTEINNQIKENMANRTTTAIPTATETPVKAKSCVDKLGTHSCKILAKRYPNYDLCKVLKVMSIHCTRYCGLCGARMQELNKHVIKPGTVKQELKKRIRKPVCKDFSKIFCKRFQIHCDEDSLNGKRMRYYCRKRCKTC